jgi:3D (Asp-Asp-Asp) domain-containing protein
MTELDNLNRLTAVDHEILLQVRSARRHELRAKVQLAARETRLQRAIGEAGAEARSLAAVRAERSAYVGRLASREALDAQQVTRLEAEARAAEARAEQLTHTPPAAVLASPVDLRTTQASAGSTISVVSTGYCLSGRTATGIPAGWGVAAVDPSVIPLGTHLLIPGYGEAVAADTGGAVVGGRIDLWFPTCAQAGGWGSRSVTIALH